MKENFERLFTESLANYEMPYEKGAWEQFSKRLDGSPSTPFYRKWWMAATVGTVLVGSATFFMLSGSEQPEKHHSASTAAAQESPVPVNATSGQPTDGSSAEKISEKIHPESGSPETHSDNNRTAALTPAAATAHDLQAIPVSEVNTAVNVPQLQNNHNSEITYRDLILPAAICLNEALDIINPNDKASIQVVLPGGKQRTLRAGEQLAVKADKPGTIVVVNGKKTHEISVTGSSAHVYVDVDASMLYNEGIPTLRFIATGTDQIVSWDSNISSRKAEKNELIVHPWTEREIIVNVTVADQNGCELTEERRVTLKDPYNLIAMSGFNPLDADPRNNRFMPYALQERETPFELTIMDPNNMQAVYRTSDANQGWDGIDSRSGQLVPMNSTWLWVVVMKNPMQGEPSEYRGLITRQNH